MSLGPTAVAAIAPVGSACPCTTGSTTGGSRGNGVVDSSDAPVAASAADAGSPTPGAVTAVAANRGTQTLVDALAGIPAITASGDTGAPDAIRKVSTNCSWNAATWRLTAWNCRACSENSAAIAADTSSSAAAIRPVVGAAAASVAAPNNVPIRAISLTAGPTASGTTNTYDICPLRVFRSAPN
ncbi:hypothetical protein GCM10027213_04060 [Mycobacterium bourgelatii]